MRFSEYKPSKYVKGTRLIIEGDEGITLRPETLGTALEKTRGHREIEIGDEAFDEKVYIQGRPEVLHAVLDAETRAVVRELLEGRVRVAGSHDVDVAAQVAIKDGYLQADFRQDWTDAPQSLLPGVLSALLSISRRLAPPPHIVERLAENARQDPEWRVRRKNVRQLAGRYPDHPVTREVLEKACQDERQEVQLQAAILLGGPQGNAVLLEVASREWADDSCAARAIAALGERLPRESAHTILTHALRTRRMETAHACLAGLGRIGDPTAIATLVKVLSVEKGSLAVEAARALGASSAQGSETHLLEALRRGASEVRVAVAEALGRVGSAAAILPLKDAAGQDGTLRRAVRQAVAQIQSRLGGASPGQLSLAEPDAGHLSLADEDPRGRVSIAEAGARVRGDE